jgi:hypothetical protein
LYEAGDQKRKEKKRKEKRRGVKTTIPEKSKKCV